MHVRELFDLSGKVAVVTGGSRGLGKEIALGLGEAGAKVVISARREEWLVPAVAELRAQEITCHGVKADVRNLAEVALLRDETLNHFGKVDVLVNNAGISWGAPAEEMPLEKWRDVLDVNATGTFLCSQLFGREMIKQKKGKIINVTSVAGLVGEHPLVMKTVGYHASKGAIIAFTRQLAVEWACFNICVNAIAPGFFPTRLSTAVIRGKEELMQSFIPLGRLGQEGELKGVAVFLAADASNYITGQVIAVDGGRTAL